jgi:hypothetical protein
VLSSKATRILGGVLAGLALPAAAALGCRTSLAPACRDMCLCSPCTDNDFDTCVTSGEAAQAAAEKQGCLDAFDTYLGCFEDNASCHTPASDPCIRAEIALLACSGRGSPFTSTCDQAQVKADQCNGSVTTPAAVVCEGLVACTAQCTLNASCDAILGMVPDPALTTCTNACEADAGISLPPSPPAPPH